MIKVTRLNHSELWINAELIEFVESTPDTVISLNNHTKVIVKETPDEVVKAVLEYRRQILHQKPQLKEYKEG